MNAPVTASCVLVGNELLSGKIRDSNAHFLARWLRPRGVDLQRIQVVPDDIPVMSQVIREESARSTMVFTSGGIGPTHDDLTYAGVAHAFGLTIQRNAELRARMEAWYGGPQPEVRLRMADIPHPCDLIPVEGLWVPVVRVKNVHVLPGIPQLFERMLQGLHVHVATGAPFTLLSVDTNQHEEDLAPAMEAVLHEHPGLEMGSYPRMDGADHRVRITLEARDAALCGKALDALVARMDPAQVVRVKR